MMDKDLSIILNSSLDAFLTAAFDIVSHDSDLGAHFVKLLEFQKLAIKKRLRWEKQGLHVPPFLIVSISSDCDLKCKGCYYFARKRSAAQEMSKRMLNNIMAEARELGISIIILAGGEPLKRHDIFCITENYTDIIFPVFTNGLLISTETRTAFQKQRHVFPVISLEGGKNDTNQRRGAGVFEKIMRIIETLNHENMFYGISLTVTRQNFASIFNEAYIERFISLGCKLFFFVEYTPIQKGTDDLVITDRQKFKVSSLVDSYRLRYPALFVAFPGVEEKFGGCLGAGRGLVHISPEGAVEPCPFVPYSDADLNCLSLKEALKSSKLLSIIRENHETLRELKGGCVLWKSRQWLLQEQGKEDICS
jgi:MoaA/NifB/PqqE/SkfB family radical SAM enzyme